MNLKSERNGIIESIRRILIILVGGFLAYSILTLYITHPTTFATKKEVRKEVTEAKAERTQNAARSQKSVMDILVIQNNLGWILKAQGDLQLEIKGMKEGQSKILEAVNKIKR